MRGRFQNPTDTQIRALLERVRTIAVVGLSPKASRPSHQVAAAMQNFGYRIIPVRPAVDKVLGEPAYGSLHDVPAGTVDMVNVFRAPQHVEPVVDACVELGIAALWLQDGVVNETQALRAREAGITVIMDRCVYRDYVNFSPRKPGDSFRAGRPERH